MTSLIETIPIELQTLIFEYFLFHVSNFNPHAKKLSMKNLLILDFFLENIKIKKYSVKYEDEIRNTIMSGYIHGHIKNDLLYPNAKCHWCVNIIPNNKPFVIDVLDNLYCGYSCLSIGREASRYINNYSMTYADNRYVNLSNCSICCSKNLNSQECQICGFRKWNEYIKHWTLDGMKKFKICTKCKNNLGRKYKSTTIINKLIDLLIK